MSPGISAESPRGCLARGSWKDAERQAFHTALVAMDDAQRAAAVSQLLTALNEGRLHADAAGPVL